MCVRAQDPNYVKRKEKGKIKEGLGVSIYVVQQSQDSQTTGGTHMGTHKYICVCVCVTDGSSSTPPTFLSMYYEE